MDIKRLTSQVNKLSVSENQSNIKLEIPLLNNKKSKEFFIKSKVMIIMKGLPGSGKSTIAKAFLKLYPSSVVCSADKYFERTRKYKYDAALLPEAHASCQNAAVSYAKNQTRLIIIDNSNVQNWEMEFYLKLAKAFNYITFVIEPNTSWSKDAKTLSEINLHGVDLSILKKKLKSYENISPVFLGWFMNDADSYAILEIACDWLKSAMRVTEFREDFRKRLGITSGPQLAYHFSKGSIALRESRLLHCTSKYTAKEEAASLNEYMKSDLIIKWIGKVSPLSIVAYIITPNTFGAKVALTEEQLEIWGGDDEGSQVGKRKRKRYYPPQKPGDKKVNIPVHKPEIKDLRKRSFLRKARQNPTQLMKRNYSKAIKAHITLGTAAGTQPAQTGVEMVSCLRNPKEMERGITIQMAGGILKKFGKGFWGIYPDQKVIVESIFSCHP